MLDRRKLPFGLAVVPVRARPRERSPKPIRVASATTEPEPRSADELTPAYCSRGSRDNRRVLDGESGLLKPYVLRLLIEWVRDAPESRVKSAKGLPRIEPAAPCAQLSNRSMPRVGAPASAAGAVSCCL